MWKQYCLGCHQGKAAVAGFDLLRFPDEQALQNEPRKWFSALTRVRSMEMPPKGAPAPSLADREKFVGWLDNKLRTAACADGISPLPAPVKRLNRSEYAATVRDLLNIHINAAANLPADGAGGEGFDNAAETLFLSPMHAEKYLDAAKQALEYADKDPKARGVFLIAEPEGEVTAEMAARRVLDAFLPRAFRRPVSQPEIEKYLALFRSAQNRGENYDDSILYALQAVLISPNFLFRIPEVNRTADPQVNGDYELASRLSYFLWGSMPDEALFELASQGRLKDPEVLKAQVIRMLQDTRSREFAENFVEQWLATRELGRDIKPDPKAFPAYYDAEIASGIRYEPILFFQEILKENLSLLNLIDSKFTFLSNKLQKHYGIQLKEKVGQQPVRVELPEGTHRGGLTGMAAVLAVSSYPQRTSPVLRGKWILEALLGTPPPPPPPNVPELKEHEGATPQTLRERLMQHRANPTCASCHNRIDPLGFSLENYNVLGLWRTEDNGKPIDAAAETVDGRKFEGPEGLKAYLLDQKETVMRNLTSKLLGYALGRGLTLEDQCTVDAIVRDLEHNNYSAHTLIFGIVNSVPFQYQPGTVPGRPVTSQNRFQQEVNR